MDKSKMRSRLASLSFTEKIKILEKLRDRDKTIAAAGLRKGDFMDRPNRYGRDTIIAISEDGTDFSNLPALEMFDKMQDVTTYDAGIPTAVEVGDIVAIGAEGPSNPTVAALHAYSQNLKSLFCRITFKDGDSTVIECVISYLKIESNRFILHLKRLS
jgi:hypothetical protein